MNNSETALVHRPGPEMDAMYLDEKTLLVGNGYRTNEAAYKQIKAVLENWAVDREETNVHTRRELEKRGIDVISFQMPELIVGSGGARCMTMPLLRRSNPQERKQ